MTKRIALCLALAVAIFAYSCGSDDPTEPPPPGPTSVTLLAVQDCTIYEDSLGASANGAGNWFHTGVTALGGPSGEPPEIRRALVAFGVAGGVPAGATIDSVFLVLRVERQPPGDGNRLHKLHKATTLWGEGASAPLSPGEGGGTIPETGDATWLHTFFDTLMWNAPGGDFVPGASDSIMINGVNFYTFGSTPEMVADVQNWLDNSSTDFGWIILGDEGTHTTGRRFGSRSNIQDPSFRPRLIIFYTE